MLVGSGDDDRRRPRGCAGCARPAHARARACGCCRGHWRDVAARQPRPTSPGADRRAPPSDLGARAIVRGEGLLGHPGSASAARASHAGADSCSKAEPSLSKGYGLIERFSEDVDILVTSPARGDSRQVTRDACSGRIDRRTSQRTLGVEWLEARCARPGQDCHTVPTCSPTHVSITSVVAIAGRGPRRPA